MSDTLNPDDLPDPEKLQPQGVRPLNKKVLVVDDDESFCRLIVKLLHIAKYDVYQVHNGLDAVPFLSTRHIDLVLLDFDLPGMDGIKLLSTLRRNMATKHLPIIMLTAHSTSDHVRECAHFGIQGFIVKQRLNSEDLASRIEQAIAPQ